MTIIKDTEVIAANETMPDYAMRNFMDGRDNGRVINRLHIPQASSRYTRNVEPHPLELISTFLEKTLAACEEEDLQVFYQHFLWLGASALTWNYYLKGFVCSRDSDNTIGKPMVKFFKELLRHRYRDQVFIKEEIVSTKATKNENRKYFR